MPVQRRLAWQLLTTTFRAVERNYMPVQRRLASLGCMGEGNGHSHYSRPTVKRGVFRGSEAHRRALKTIRRVMIQI